MRIAVGLGVMALGAAVAVAGWVCGVRSGESAWGAVGGLVGGNIIWYGVLVLAYWDTPRRVKSGPALTPESLGLYVPGGVR